MGVWFPAMKANGEPATYLEGETLKVGDHTYVETMQDINRAIINPAFIVPFMGVPLALGAASVLHFRTGDTRRGWLLASATGTYLVGVLGVTIRGNIPLNDALDAFDLPAARALQQLLGVPEQMAFAALIPLGKPVKQLTKLSRKPVEDFAVLERWDGPALEEG